MNQRLMPVPGEFYRHFKNKMYQIVTIAYHSENQEPMVVYQALYGDYKVWVRPLAMFMEEVDHEKYPEVTQKYRFEKVTPGNPETTAAETSEPRVETSVAVKETDHFSAENGYGGERPMSPYLLEFFDAMDVKNYDKMLEAVAKMAAHATRKEVDDICMVLDLQPTGDSVAELAAEIRRHILMLKRFDGVRLR